MPDAVLFDFTGPSAIPEQFLAQAKKEAASVGYAQGWTQGMSEARTQQAGIIAGAKQAAADAAGQRAAALRSALTALDSAAQQVERSAIPAAEALEDLILAAAIDIAEALVGRELSDPDIAAEAALARVLKLTAPGADVVVRLNPHDYDLLMEGDEWSKATATISGRTVTLRPDPSLAAGDALAVSGATTIDGRVAEGVQRIREYLSR